MTTSKGVIALSNTCARCHRGLKDPKSIGRKLGPVCWKKTQAARAQMSLDFEDSEQVESQPEGGGDSLGRTCSA